MSELLAQILSFLNIQFVHITHPPVFTCTEASLHLADVPGIPTKNLFLTTKAKDQYFLLTTSELSKVNLKAFAALIGCGKLSFASAEDLQKLLGIAAGCVSLLALCNDKDKKVRAYVDREIWGIDPIHCHPLVNSETLLITPRELERFAQYIGHSLNIIEVPKVI